MKKLLKSKKILAIVLALTMVFSMSSAVFAGNPGDYLAGSAIPPTSASDCSTYLVTTPAASTSIDVTLVIEAGDAVEYYMPNTGSAFRKEIPVTLTSSAAVQFTVTDLLNKVNGTNGLAFYGTGSSAFTKSTNYLQEVTYGGASWDAGQWGFDGWVFRVNDKFPVEPTADSLGYQGTSILDTYLQDGDVIHFFYDFPSDFDPTSGSAAATYVRGIVDSFTSSSLTLQMQGHTTYIQPTGYYIMSVNNYEDLGAGVSVGLYNSSGILLDTEITGSGGTVTFSGTFAEDQEYIVKSVSTEYIPTEDWVDFVEGAYFDLTGAFSKIIL